MHYVQMKVYTMIYLEIIENFKVNLFLTSFGNHAGHTYTHTHTILQTKSIQMFNLYCSSLTIK